MNASLCECGTKAAQNTVEYMRLKKLIAQSMNTNKP